MIRETVQTELPDRLRSCLHELVLKQARLTPDVTAVVSSGESVTYAELISRSSQLARSLQAMGVGAEVGVGVCLERGVDMVVALLGTMMAGGAYVPLDPDYPPDRLNFMADDVAAPVILTTRQFAGRFAGGKHAVRLMDEHTEAVAPDVTPPESSAGPSTTAYIIYTSGSTGQPKGVRVPHRGIVNRMCWMQDEYGMTPDDVMLQKTPYSFDVSVCEFFWPLTVGARLVMAEPGRHQDPFYLASVIREAGVTTLHFVPTMLGLFLAAVRGTPDATALGGVRRVICIGEALPVAIADAAAEILGGDLHNLYGPTEASVHVSHFKYVPGADYPNGVPIGKAIANAQLYVLDEYLDAVADGELGELCIGGICLASGYHNRPRLTAEKFIPNPFAPGRLYRTGDLARLRPDGNIEYAGRTDHQIKLNGNRIELGEIEAALTDHPAITQAAVLVRAHPSGHQQLVAFVSVVGTAPDPGEMRAWLARRLPVYMLPARFELLERLPCLTNGKIDRNALAAAPATDERVACERLVAEAWRRTLGKNPDGDFFAQGGTPLLAAQMIGALRKETGVALPPDMVQKHPTAQAMTALLLQRKRQAAERAAASRPAGFIRAGASGRDTHVTRNWSALA